MGPCTLGKYTCIRNRWSNKFREPGPGNTSKVFGDYRPFGAPYATTRRANSEAGSGFDCHHDRQWHYRHHSPHNLHLKLILFSTSVNSVARLHPASTFMLYRWLQWAMLAARDSDGLTEILILLVNAHGTVAKWAALFPRPLPERAASWRDGESLSRTRQVSLTTRISLLAFCCRVGIVVAENYVWHQLDAGQTGKNHTIYLR